MNKGLLTSRPVTLLLIVWRYLMALFYAAEAIVVWWHPLPKFFVSGSLAIIAMVWVGMNIISREISRGERRP